MGAERFAASIGNPNFLLSNAKVVKCGDVVSHATWLFERAIAPYSRGELAGWPILRAEAEAYQADSAASVPNIALEAEVRGVSVSDLVSRVQTNTAYFDQVRAQIAGTSGRHRDAINQLTDFDAIADYDFSTGWPEV